MRSKGQEPCYATTLRTGYSIVEVEVKMGVDTGHFLVVEMEDIGNYAIIKHASWWMENLDNIIEWFDETGIAPRYKHEGMVLTFECKEDLALFVLRWA